MSFKTKGSIYLALFIFVLTISFSYAAVPDSIDRATYEVDRAGREELESLGHKKQVSTQEAEEPQETAVIPEGEKRFFVKEIILDGCESFSPEDFSKAINKYTNREVALSELNVLTSEIEREYLKKGVVAAVLLLPQDTKSETITLQVIEAKMGRLKIQEHKYFNNERLSYYWDIEPGEVLRYDKIGTALQIMGRNPDREVKSILQAGKKPGTTDVILAAETTFPVHAFATFDNDGVTSSGKSRLNYGIRHNNFIGLDDTLLAGYTQGTHFRGKYFYHSVPVSPKNTFLTYGYSDSHSAPKKEYTQYGISSDAVSTTFSLHKEFYSPEAYVGEVLAGFDTNDKVIRTNDGVYNKDRLRVASVGGTYIHRGPGSNTVFSSQFYQGLYGFGASPKDNPFASRNGQAHSGFSKTSLEIDHFRSLPLDLLASIKYRQQISPDPLSPQQEFNLGGMDSVRGYPAADFLADNAQVCNLELISPAFFIPEGWRIPYAEDSIKNQTSLVGFLDYGHGNRNGTMSGGEKKAVNYTGIGAGLRFKLFNQATLRLEWGVNVGDKPITESGKTQFHFAVNFQEQAPEEIARIKKIIEADNIKKWTQQLVDLELSQPDSPVRARLYSYFWAADIAYKEGRLKDSRELYQQAIQLSRSLLMQAEDYVREYVSLSKELENKIELANKNYNQGRIDKAKTLLTEVVSSARLPRASFEY